MTLEHKHVGSANGFGVAHIHLAIGEVVGGGLENIDAELVRNVGGQLGMRPGCYENEIFIGFPLENCTHRVSKRRSSVTRPIINRCFD